MSGGRFLYKQYEIGYIADQIEQFIESNDDKRENEWGDQIGREYPTAVIAEFANAVKALRIAQIYAQRVDWLISGDDGEDGFLRRLAEDLTELG